MCNSQHQSGKPSACFVSNNFFFFKRFILFIAQLTTPYCYLQDLLLSGTVKKVQGVNSCQVFI